jgi:predicted permease
MVIMLEYNKQISARGAKRSLTALVKQSLINSLKTPVVAAALLAMILVLLGVSVTKELQNILNLIGSATTGVATFETGLILAAYQFKATVETAGNTLVKMIGQPLLVAVLVAAFGVGKPLSSEAILLCSLPTALVPPMFAIRYHVYEADAASTLLLTTLSMVVVLPIAMALTGA